MTWVKIDDLFPDHPKIVALTDAAFRTHVTGLCYAARYLTDGHIPTGSLRTIGPRKAATELEAAGLWTKTDHGWQIRDFLDYNPSRDDVETKRAAARIRIARAREVRTNTTRT